MMQLSLHLLGPPRVKLAESDIEVKPRKALALLIYLAVTAERHSRDALATLLWPNSDQGRARHSLRSRLSELNLILGGDWLETDRESVSLRPDFWLDVTEFQQALAADTGDPQFLIAAIDLYHDDFLTGFTLPDCPEFDEWQFFQSESLRQALASALERLVGMLSGQGDDEAAIPHARRWLALDPLHEPTHSQLMQLYAQAGQQAAALRQYQVCVETLENELGLPPSEETTTLYQAIRTGSFGNKSASVKSIENRKSKIVNRHNLPTQTTSFIGREGELADIKRLLLEEADCRLLNLVGPGGIGKTRLALATAAQLLEAFADGVYFVSLTPVGEAEDIVPAMATALNLTFYGQADPKTQLLDYLSQKQMLLVVDNFEHLLNKVDLLSDIRHAALNVTLLATSRERLGLQEEWVYEVRGLAFPTYDDQTLEVSKTSKVLTQYSAVELFTQRARQTMVSFVPSDAEIAEIGRICRLVEGLPLGIELAAAWIRTLSCREIATEIENSLDFLITTHRNLPERHRSLYAVFDRSWQLLNDDERRVFASCSVFRGGFTRAAILQVTGTTLPTLAALVDKSLFRREATERYAIHEFARQFARKKHQSMPETEVKATYQEHAQFFLNLVHKQEAALFGPQPQQAISIIQADLENVHAAWNWAWAQRQMTLIARVLEPLTRFYKMADLVHTAEQFFAATLKQKKLASLSREQVQLFGWVSYYQAEMLYLLAHYDEAAIIAEEVDAMLAEEAPGLQVRNQILLGLIAYKQGPMEKARQHIEWGYALSLQVDDDRLLAYALDNLGNITHILKVADFGLAYHQQACLIARDQGDRWALATYLSNLGWMHYDKWELEAALDYFQQALELMKQLNVHYDMIETLLRIGHAYDRLRKDDLALEHFQQAAQITQALGLKDVSQAWMAIGNIYRRRGDWDQALGWLEKARQLLVELGKRAMVAMCLSNMGLLFSGRGQYETARVHHQEALDIYARLKMALGVSHQHCYLGAVNRHLGNYPEARKHQDQALNQVKALGELAFQPYILLETAKAAFNQKEYTWAKTDTDACLQLLDNIGPQQHLFRQQTTTLDAHILQAKLMHIQGDSGNAFWQLEKMLQATQSQTNQAALYYARWQLGQDSECGRQALALYQKLYARRPYFQYRQRIDELTAET